MGSSKTISFKGNGSRDFSFFLILTHGYLCDVIRVEYKARTVRLHGGQFDKDYRCENFRFWDLNIRDRHVNRGFHLIVPLRASQACKVFCSEFKTKKNNIFLHTPFWHTLLDGNGSHSWILRHEERILFTIQHLHGLILDSNPAIICKLFGAFTNKLNTKSFENSWSAIPV